MARALNCTRCGMYYDDYSTPAGYSHNPTMYNALLRIDVDLDRKSANRDIIDLCPDCKASFEDWLREDIRWTNNRPF